jgi:hypothetical protein
MSRDPARGLLVRRSAERASALRAVPNTSAGMVRASALERKPLDMWRASYEENG